MKKQSVKSAFVSGVLVVLSMALIGPGECAAREEIPFDETDIFFEFNSTDLDLGIQIFFDAEGWEMVAVSGPDGKVFAVRNGSGLKLIGSTEVFTESEEPELDEGDLAAAIAEFQFMFPEGEYVFRGKTIEGDFLIGSAELAHALPAPVSVDVEEFPTVGWNDESMPGDPEIVGYQAVVELVAIVDEEEEVFVFQVDVPANVFEVTVPEEFVDVIEAFDDEEAVEELKVEIIAIAANGNKSITEVELELE